MRARLPRMADNEEFALMEKRRAQGSDYLEIDTAGNEL